MSRKIRILGISVPTWLILVFVLGVTAVAAWGAYVALTTATGAAGGVTMTLNNPACTQITPGDRGAVVFNDCSIVGGGFNLDFDNASPNLEFEYKFRANNGNSFDVCWIGDSVLTSPPAGVTVTAEPTNAGNIIPGGFRTIIYRVLMDSSIVPLSSIDWSIETQFEDAAVGPCVP